MDKVSNRATNHALAIEKYILAKDGNRPDLLRQSFAGGATLDMVLNTNAISFPSHVAGRTEISDVLVSRFGETYENVYTFCLGEAPSNSAAHHANKWLVGMSTKATGELRVGCGRYDWHFSPTTGLVQHLRITIAHMYVYPALELELVMDWLQRLPYPWCPVNEIAEMAPPLEDMEQIIRYLKS